MPCRQNDRAAHTVRLEKGAPAPPSPISTDDVKGLYPVSRCSIIESTQSYTCFEKVGQSEWCRGSLQIPTSQ